MDAVHALAKTLSSNASGRTISVDTGYLSPFTFAAFHLVVPATRLTWSEHVCQEKGISYIYLIRKRVDSDREDQLLVHGHPSPGIAQLDLTQGYDRSCQDAPSFKGVLTGI